ncbi:MAG: hypothetical protein UC708_02210 [Anaerovoracaceae bacterium]|nr:hypothetical protein [Anaerovoracaceae bacterium]
MSLSRYKSNKKLIDRISLGIKHGRIFHAYILEGDALSYKDDFAVDLCKAVVCTEMPGVGCDSCINCRKIDHDNYEDLYVVEADGMSVKDEQIAKLQAELKKKPAGDRHLSIIKDADTMTLRAQNRLLKTLEEPFAGTVIILLSENRENLIDTIRSRCVLYRLEDERSDSSGGEKAEAVFEAISEKKGFFKGKEVLSANIKSREDALELLDGLEHIYQKMLKWEDDRRTLFTKDEIFRSIELIEEARRDLLFKVNYQYALKNLILKMEI